MRPPPDQKPVLTGSRGDSGRGSSPSKPKSSPPPRTDVQSSGGGYGLKQAAKFKKTAPYRGAVKAAYEAAPSKVRHERIADAVAHAAKTQNLSPEMAAVLHEHMSRIARNAQLAQGRRVQDVTTGKELAKANDYLAAHAEITKLAAKFPHHEGFFASLLHRVYGHPAAEGQGGVTASATPLGAGAMGSVATGLPAKVVKNVGFTIAENPREQIPKLASDTAQSVVSIPAGLVRTGLHPLEAAKAIGADYARRYGPLVSNDPQGEAKFRARLRKEGVAPELFDVATAAATAGATVGRGAQLAAKAGVLGKTAERIATTRPALRISGETAVKQPVSENFVRNAAGAARDTARARVQAKRAGHENADAVVREAQARGEVTPVRKHKAAKLQRTQVARGKSIAVQSMKAEQQHETSAARAAIGSLNKHERRALHQAMIHGITTPGAALKFLPQHQARVEGERAALAARTGKAIPAAQNELPALKWLQEHAHEAFTPRLAAVVKGEGERAARLARSDPGVAAEQAVLRRYAPQAELLGVTRHEGEDAAAFVSRVAQRARAEGLATPGYFPSEKRPAGVFASFAVGGRKAIQGPKAYTGTLTRTGRENVNPDVLVRGIAKNIKRKYNWNLVAQTFDQHAFAWSKNKTPNQLLDEIDRRGIDPNSVALWNPGRFKAQHDAHATTEGADLEHGTVTHEAADVHDALQHAAPGLDLRKLATAPEDFKQSAGWSIVPKAVHQEVMADTKPSGAIGRGYDISKGKVSRVLLATPAWLSFQVAANTFLTGLAGTGPVNAVKAQLWWRTLSHEERAAIEPYIGVHKFYDEQTHLGATANNRMVNAWRAFKQTTLYQGAHKANPLDAIFRADNAQNAFFRKAVFYTDAKRAAYQRMGENTAAITRIQHRVVNTLKLDPEGRARALIADNAELERYAKHVNDFLGDYTTYTARERKLLGRSVMFYGFLRYSVKFAFYTMPVEHPIMSSILLQLGRLEKDELKRIFGPDTPPIWEIGNYYSKNGKLRIPLVRMNPFFNAQQFHGVGSLFGVVSPAAQIIVNQIAGKNVALDQLYTVGGRPEQATKGGMLGPIGRARIALEEFLRLSPYYRGAEKAGIPGIAKPLRGKQTSDALLFSPQPVRYKTTAKIAEQQQRVARENQQNAADLWRQQLAPITGTTGSEVILQAHQYAASKRKKTGAPASSGLDYSHLIGGDTLDYSHLLNTAP
jgi:hypothetical protein